MIKISGAAELHISVDLICGTTVAELHNSVDLLCDTLAAEQGKFTLWYNRLLAVRLFSFKSV